MRWRVAPRGLRASAIVAAVCALCVFSGCKVEEDKLSACEADEALCPTSSKIATDVGCDCECVAGYAGITPTREFAGEISTCLPPSLNIQTGSDEQRDETAAMTATQYNQRVYKYCSDTVANYLTELIEEQQRPKDLGSMCVGPRIKCKCGTTGAKEQTTQCSTPCADVECDSNNCQPLLKVGGVIDAIGCKCSRVTSCGAKTPSAQDPPVCLNRIAAILKKRAKKAAEASAAASALETE